MSTKDVYVNKIIKEPYRDIDEEYCCWAVVVEVYHDGGFWERVIRRCKKSEIDQIKPGYSWIE